MLFRAISIAIVIGLLHGSADAQAQPQPATQSIAKPAARAAEKYGSNARAGATFTHDGVKLYYEVYGAGEPVLLVHGNGGKIADLAAQIDHFRKRYKVIAMDSRDQGRSGDSTDRITYEKMADDLAAQIDHFRKRYKVIAMDSRDQGRSGDSTDRITYEKMADGLAALLDHLQSG